MADEEKTGTVLKILTGVQSGVDVFLIDGDYTLGSGDDDDIQILDVSLKPGHARLSIRPGKIEIAGAAGELRSRNGAVLTAGGDLQEIEPLDIVSAGTSRFALGPRHGNWASIAEAEDDSAPAPPRRARSWGGAGKSGKGAAAADVAVWQSWHAALPVAAVLVLIGGGVWLSPFAQAKRGPSADELARNELASVRDAVHGFDFGKAIQVEQQVDGVIYVTGFVDTPVQRRAIIAATRDVEVPPRVRLQVLETMRSELANLIAEEKVDVAYTLSPDGKATLSGTVLDPAKANKVVDLVKERIVGLGGLVSNIKTAPGLLAEVKDLAARSQIEPLVLLRLDGDLIEASGVLPTEKIDPWVGFLQAYSSQFASAIPLRSLVQLQNPDGTTVDAPAPAGKALVLGTSTRTTDDVPLDVSRLQTGAFELADVFVGQGGADGAATVTGAGNGQAVDGTGQAPIEGVAGAGAIEPRLDLAALLGNVRAPARDAANLVSASADPRGGSITGGWLRGDGAVSGTGATAGGTGGQTGPRTAAETAANRLPITDAEGRGAGGAGAAGAASLLGSSGTESDATALPFGPENRPNSLLAALDVDAQGRVTRPRGGEGEAALTAENATTADDTTPSARTGTATGAASAPAGSGAAQVDGDANASQRPMAAPADPGIALDAATSMARRLIEMWNSGTLPSDDQGKLLARSMEALQRGEVSSGNPPIDFDPIVKRYAPLLADSRFADERQDLCWANSKLTQTTVAGALFWLDLLSVTRDISLGDLEADIQPAILDAALNPKQAESCALRNGRSVRSIYLTEIERNPTFIGFITRELPAFTLDIVGADVAAGRYIQMRDGRKLRAGGAPDETSRLAIIGELGVAVKREDGYAATIFGQDVSWLVR